MKRLDLALENLQVERLLDQPLNVLNPYRLRL